MRGSRLELLREDPLADLEHDIGDRRGVLLAARDGHLEIVEHVVVGLARGLQLPRLASGQRVQRQLYVVLQLLGGLRARGLVVDQLVLSARAFAALGLAAPAREAIDAVYTPAQVVRAEPEGERALEPHGLGVLVVQPRVVARERGGPHRTELALTL